MEGLPLINWDYIKSLPLLLSLLKAIKDALIRAFEDFDIPVIHDADIGHAPSQIQFMNGVIGTVSYKQGKRLFFRNGINKRG